MQPQDERLGKNYDRAASFYEVSAAIFSAGKIRASKKHAIHQIPAGAQALFLGVGSGEDAIIAASQGIEVTCIDLSQKMLDKLQRKLAARGLKANIICLNAFDYDRFESYDAVCAHYFLNIFLKSDMEQMLIHSARFVKPGGKYLIADVAQAQGNWLAKLFNVVYLKLAMVSFWMLGLVPLHRNYDYLPVLPVAGLSVDHIRHFRFLKWGPILFQTTVAVKAAAGEKHSS